MRLLNDNVLYEFTVEQGSRNTDHGDPCCYHQSDSDSDPLFRIVIRYRKFQAPIRRPVQVTEQSFDLPLNALRVISQVLAQLEVPAQIGEQMAEHLGFFGERLAMRIRGGEIPVSVRLDVKVISPETAGGIRTRMESAREVAEEEEAVPARSSIEALEKVRVGVGGRECAICLEEQRVGEEVARMPCGHLYHCNCIVEWLHRTHFCPFCRFKMHC